MFIDIGNEITINLSQCLSVQPLDIAAGTTFNNEVLAADAHAIQFGYSTGALTIRFSSKTDRDAKFEECRLLGAALRSSVMRAHSPQVVRPVFTPTKLQQ